MVFQSLCFSACVLECGSPLPLSCTPRSAEPILPFSFVVANHRTTSPPLLGGDLSRLGGGERNSFRPDRTKVAPQPSERALAPFHVAAFSLARHLSHITRHFRMRYSGTKRFLVLGLKFSPVGQCLPRWSLGGCGPAHRLVRRSL